MSTAELASNWLKKAESDLLVAKYVLVELWPKQIYISGHHSQQCVEKALKFFLVVGNLFKPV